MISYAQIPFPVRHTTVSFFILLIVTEIQSFESNVILITIDIDVCHTENLQKTVNQLA